MVANCQPGNNEKWKPLQRIEKHGRERRIDERQLFAEQIGVTELIQRARVIQRGSTQDVDA